MAFNSNKTQSLKSTNGKYGTEGADPKSDQGKYVKKVNDFIDKYCTKFNNALVTKNNEEGGVKTVQDIKKCFDDSFKGYYKGSKRFGLFSRTTKVLKEMEKKLNKLTKKGDKKNKGLLVVDGVNSNGVKLDDVINAFKYDSKRDYNSDLGKRSAIDDRAVYGFFTADLPKTIKNIYKGRNDKLKKIENTIDFVNRFFDKLDKACKSAKDKLVAAKMEAKKQDAEIIVLEAGAENLKELVQESGNKKDQISVKEQEKAINDLTSNMEEINKKVNEIGKKFEEKVALKGKLLLFAEMFFYKRTIDDKKKKELKEILKITDDKIEDDDLIISLSSKIEELTKEINDIRAKIIDSDAGLKNNRDEIEKIQKGQQKMQGKLDKDKEAQEKNFKLENGILTINNMAEFWEHYIGLKEKANMWAETKKIVISGNVDLSKIDISKNSDGNGVFHGFYRLTSVEAKGLIGALGKDAFGWCESLASFNAGAGNDYNYNIPERVVSEIAFYRSGASVANGFSANTEATTIGNQAFYESGLTKINLPNVTDIGASAFCNCRKLTEVILGPSIAADKIGNSAFLGCNSISKVTISKGNRQDDKINEIKSKICTQAKKQEKTNENPNGIEFVIK